MCTGSREPNNQSAYLTIIFLRKYEACHVYKPIPIQENVQKTLKLFFSCPKVLSFCLKSVPWIGNELVGDDVENCENSQLTPKISRNFVSIEILFK